MQQVIHSQFDTDTFGIPFYRISMWREPDLEGELSPLLKRRPLMIDAKIGSNEIDRHRFLLRHGFRHVCTQVALVRGPDRAGERVSAVAITEGLNSSDDTIRRHAHNFRFDRFALDPMIDPAAHARLYTRWIANSLSGRMLVASRGSDFCSFAPVGDYLKIDLLSVLNEGVGIGRSLVLAVVEYAAGQGLQGVRVVTECANLAAWKLYQRCGFTVSGFVNCYHFVAA